MIAALILILAAVLYRIGIPLFLHDSEFVATFGNFCPLAAIVLCGAAWLPRSPKDAGHPRARSSRWSDLRQYAWLAVPLVALFISDLIINAHYRVDLVSGEMAVRYGAFACVAGIGLALRRNPTFGRVLLGSVAGSVVFYLVTNTGSWLGNPAYPQNAAGWLQAMTVGVPGFPPTWFFFRNTLAGDLLFTALFAGSMAVSAKTTERGMKRATESDLGAPNTPGTPNTPGAISQTV